MDREFEKKKKKMSMTMGEEREAKEEISGVTLARSPAAQRAALLGLRENL